MTISKYKVERTCKVCKKKFVMPRCHLNNKSCEPGKFCSQKCFHRSSELRESRVGSGNPNWKGSKVGYSGIHTWIRKKKKKPKLCECCKKVPPHDLANISQEYKRDITDWEYLCRKCHMKKDGRLKAITSGNKFKEYNLNKKGNKCKSK